MPRIPIRPELSAFGELETPLLNGSSLAQIGARNVSAQTLLRLSAILGFDFTAFLQQDCVIALIKELVDGEIELERPLGCAGTHIKSEAGSRKARSKVLIVLKAKARLE